MLLIFAIPLGGHLPFTAKFPWIRSKEILLYFYSLVYATIFMSYFVTIYWVT